MTHLVVFSCESEELPRQNSLIDLTNQLRAEVVTAIHLVFSNIRSRLQITDKVLDEVLVFDSIYNLVYALDIVIFFLRREDVYAEFLAAGVYLHAADSLNSVLIVLWKRVDYLHAREAFEYLKPNLLPYIKDFNSQKRKFLLQHFFAR